MPPEHVRFDVSKKLLVGVVCALTNGIAGFCWHELLETKAELDRLRVQYVELSVTQRLKIEELERSIARVDQAKRAP